MPWLEGEEGPWTRKEKWHDALIAIAIGVPIGVAIGLAIWRIWG